MLADLRQIFPVTLDRLPGRIVSELKLASPAPDGFSSLLGATLSSRTGSCYLPELAALELARYRLRRSLPVPSIEVSELTVNPSLELLRVGWRRLHELSVGSGHEPVAGEEIKPGKHGIPLGDMPTETIASTLFTTYNCIFPHHQGSDIFEAHRCFINRHIKELT